MTTVNATMDNLMRENRLLKERLERMNESRGELLEAYDMAHAQNAPLRQKIECLTRFLSGTPFVNFCEHLEPRHPRTPSQPTTVKAATNNQKNSQH